MTRWVFQPHRIPLILYHQQELNGSKNAAEIRKLDARTKKLDSREDIKKLKPVNCNCDCDMVPAQQTAE